MVAKMSDLKFLTKVIFIPTMLILGVSGGQTSDYYNQSVISTVAFGSCSKNSLPQTIWQSVIGQKPDLFVWLGDVVYADRRILPFVWTRNPPEVVEDIYMRFYNNTAYKKFRNSGIKIVGVWDDHDYGENGGNKNSNNKLQTQHVFLNFLDEPPDSKRRQREGIYVSYYFGTGNKTVKLILLDTRTFFDPINEDILGNEQWKWLKEQLSEDAALTIIGSSIQVLTDIPFVDRWRFYKKSFDRFLWLIRSRPRVILLSGDVHFGEISCLNESWIGYPIFDITSSGLTHTCETTLVPFSVCSWSLKRYVISKYRVGDIHLNQNFGLIRLKWNEQATEISIEIHGLDGLSLQQTVKLSDLDSKSTPASCPTRVARPTNNMKYAVYAFTFCALAIPLVLLVLIIRSTNKIFKRMFPPSEPANNCSNPIDKAVYHTHNRLKAE
ncbi:uncharacterized protein TRIADDRAFT_54771 [Trichoplax adhaerens]|uniref:PhoD-like phosphatase metallophosphatase domain-containing protein n=1 Tax=Trichoplax adhaerens TaxID=10228 RepID=B3RSY4_TRIAD|nr:hypothetical protein TRIADDRAFT_54771 [Trichoplax adhaerens]EDV26603.1 hypothetical protein TRIADDRAFT_54771 [Trichoplax adhaerens]|eukprot:XP_002110599.1 hypothetical protein TRIADDRAFT_54771 [Trichoplax adhaerens]